MSITSNQDPSPESVEPLPEAVPAQGRAEGRSRSGVWALITRLHFYAGVFIAPFLVLSALTGLAYAFTPQLDQIVYRDELRVERVAGQPRPLADQIAAARAAHPEGTIGTVGIPAGPGDTTKVVLMLPELGEKQRTVYVDPYTLEVKGALTTWWGATPLTSWLDELHRSLHLGKAGMVYSELSASWLWVIVLAGLAMWLGRRRRYRGSAPARRALLPDRSDKGVRRTRSRHAALGLWLALGLLFLSATGLTWAEQAGQRFDRVQSALDSSAPELDTALSAAPAPAGDGHAGHSGHGAASPDGVLADYDKVLATARTAGLTGPIDVAAPESAGSAWSVAQTDNTWPVRKDKIAVDASSGQVTARVDWADHPFLAQLSALGIQAHMGLLFGLANQLVLAALALSLLVVIFLGYRTWWRRRPSRDDRRALAGTPPARGAWRRTPWPVLAVGIPVVVLIGWALPILGLSLLVFVVIDVLTGIRRRERAR
ncbi:PepSY domain-containing protein [Actinocorallia longicatena]|uniref:PepSY domain-containing protein n=1 Tax=Actinocorallia longicatena TaxID=111803 RepID=A0ABP6QFG7_9ACTN